MWNPFQTEETARAYSTARPDYHALAQDIVARTIELDGRLPVALDIGAGTGMATRALRDLADVVVGVDAAAAMLAAAAPAAGVSYVHARAEQLPLRTGSADLAVVAAAFHWFDQAAMLSETRRVLRPGRWLAVYTDYFSGELAGFPGFMDWLRETYWPSYPAPRRQPFLDEEAVVAAGFELIGDETFTHEVRLGREQLGDYLLTQSNATAAIDQGRIERDVLRAWLHSEFAGLLPPGPSLGAAFGGRVWTSKALG